MDHVRNCEADITNGLSRSFSESQQMAIRAEMARLEHADEKALDDLCADSEARRLRWFSENREPFDFIGNDLLLSAYSLLLRRFGITPEDAPVVSSTDKELVFHSKNFCPTLEACVLLGLDTRHVCQRMNERSTDLLIKQLDKRLTFSRNYEKLRPYAAYCEEMISIADNQENA